MSAERERTPRSTGLVLVLALVGLGTLATVLSVREERQTVRAEQQRAADLATSQLRGELASTVGALRGADSIVSAGDTSASSFTAFADDLTTDGLFQAVAFIEVVPAADRDAFTSRTGLTIHDTDGRGGFVDGTVRERSLVVSMVSPLTDGNRAVLGFDIASDPVRLAATMHAEATGLPAMSGRISTATLDRPGLLVVAPVRDTTGATRGFVSSGIDINSLLQRAAIDIDGDDSFVLRIDGDVLVSKGAEGDADGGATRTFDLVGHQLSVWVRTGDDVELLMPVLIGAGTLMLMTAAAVALRHDRRQRDRISRGAHRSRAINDLGEALADAGDPRRIVDDLLEHTVGILDAECVSVALRNSERPNVLSVRRHGAVGRAAEVDLGSSEPAAECVRSGADVMVAETGTQTVELWLPLTFGRVLCVGALGVRWEKAGTAEEIDELRVAADTVADLASRSLERVITMTTVQEAADNLGALARALAGSGHAPDVQRAVEEHAAVVLGAETAELAIGPTNGHTSQDPDPTEIHRSIGQRRGPIVGRLTLRWRQPPLLGPAQLAVIQTMVEMIAQTLERTALTEHEHQVMVQLQQHLLPPLPDIAGLDIAVHYRPAVSVLGLGGDFYDVIDDANGNVYVVIGDLTGHGAEAVAAMTQLTTVLRSLLHGGHQLAEVGDEIDGVVARRGMYATVQIVEIQADRRVLRLLNAGHPYPVLRRRGGDAQLLTGGHRPLLGLDADDTTPPEEYAIGPGDALLVYTDGLIERRRSPLDASMRALLDVIATTKDGVTAADLVDLALAADVAGGDAAGDKTDDDTAVLAVTLLR